MDSAVSKDKVGKPVIPYPCHLQGGNQVGRDRSGTFEPSFPFTHTLQFWLFSKMGEIRRDEYCIDYNDPNPVMIWSCHGQSGNQK